MWQVIKGNREKDRDRNKEQKEDEDEGRVKKVISKIEIIKTFRN